MVVPPKHPKSSSFLVGKPMDLLGKPTILGNPHIDLSFWKPWCFGRRDLLSFERLSVTFQVGELGELGKLFRWGKMRPQLDSFRRLNPWILMNLGYENKSPFRKMRQHMGIHGCQDKELLPRRLSDIPVGGHGTKNPEKITNKTPKKVTRPTDFVCFSHSSPG